MESLQKGESLQARLLKSHRLCVQVKIEGNATPASKKRSSDLAGELIVLAQGQVSDAPSGVSYVAPDDATGKYSIVLDKSASGEIAKIYKAEAVNVTGTHSISASISNGYLVVDIDSSADLTSANSEVKIILDYLVK